MSDVNIKKLRKEDKLRKKNRQKCFDKIKTMCLNKIAFVSKTGNATSIVFRVPMIMLGYPSYKMSSCTSYLTKKIEKRGFKVILLNEMDLLIYWNLD